MLAIMTLDQRGRTFLITGATSGIGKSTALALAARGANLILASRSQPRAEAVREEMARAGAPGEITLVPLDLGDLASVRACAAAVNARPGPLHVLINNAGLAGADGLTKDGFEITFGTNHLGPFLLTMLLIDKLRASAPARIVNVASRAHKRVKDIDLTAQRRPKQGRAGLHEYSVSKLANILFTKELARRLEATGNHVGTGVNVYCLHPGVVASDIWRRIPAPVRWLMKLTMSSNDEGALTTIHCATSAAVAGETGLYYDSQRVAKPSATAEDPRLAERLWSASAAWVGADLPSAKAPAKALAHPA
jgi:retinol dehydrogenase-12